MRRALCFSPLILLLAAGCGSQAIQKPPSAAGAPEGQVYSAYTVQVSAFRERAQADRLAEALLEEGYQAWVAGEHPAAWQPWFRVCVGRFGFLREAQVIKQALLDSGYGESFVRAVR